MRRIVGLSLSLTLGLALVAAVPVAADPDNDSDNAALIIRGNCQIQWPAAPGGPLWYQTTDQVISVTTSSGVTNTTCHFRPDDRVGAFGPPPQTVKIEGFVCSGPAGASTDSFFIMNKNGIGLSRCQHPVGS